MGLFYSAIVIYIISYAYWALKDWMWRHGKTSITELIKERINKS